MLMLTFIKLKDKDERAKLAIMLNVIRSLLHKTLIMKKCYWFVNKNLIKFSRGGSNRIIKLNKNPTKLDKTKINIINSILSIKIEIKIMGYIKMIIILYNYINNFIFN